LYAGPEGAARHGIGPCGLGQCVAVTTAQGMQLILGDLSSHGRHFDHLVALRMSIVAAQRLTAVAAVDRLDRHHSIHLIHRQERAPMALVARLTTRRTTRGTTLATSLARSLRSLRGWRSFASTLSTRQSLFQRRNPRRVLHPLLLDHLLQLPDLLPQTHQHRLHRDRRALPIGIRNRKFARSLHGLDDISIEHRDLPIPRYQHTLKKYSYFLTSHDAPWGLNGYVNRVVQFHPKVLVGI
jgi:hypothetical protein